MLKYLARTRKIIGKALLLAFGCLLGVSAVASAQLETRTSFTTDVGGIVVDAGDFNHDGKADLVVGSLQGPHGSEATQVQIFLGNGDGTFGSVVHYDVGIQPLSIAISDVNHDGNPDLVVANSLSNNVSVLLGKGDGSFQPAMNFDTSTFPVRVVLADFNGDGNLDILTANEDARNIAVLLGNGDGSFQEPAITTTTLLTPEAVAIGHFTTSNQLDIAVSEEFGSVSEVEILLGKGDGTFQSEASYSVGSSPMSIVAADFRRNGTTDLAVGEFEGLGVAVLLGNGDGTFQSAVEYRLKGPQSLAVADLNGDGKLDIVAANDDPRTGAASVLNGNGDGTFQNARQYLAGIFPSCVTVADFNGDRQPDVVLADSYDVIELLNTGVVSFSPTTPLSFPPTTVGQTSSPLTVTLTNNGASALSISSISTHGQFHLTTTCKKNLSPGAQCALNVTFQPLSKGKKSGTVSISDSASSKPQIIELMGTGK